MLLPSITARTGLAASTKVVAVGSHDTASAVAASAVAAVPANRRDFAYISSGTRFSVGVEVAQPIPTEASRAANFTNELGVDGTIRYLRNLGGPWLLSECQRAWGAEGRRPELEELLDAAEALPPGGPVTAVACLEPCSASQPEWSAIRIHNETADRIRPKALAGRDGVWSVVAHLSDRSWGAAVGFVPAVKSICGGVPQFEPARQVVESGIVLVQTQVFGP